MSQLIGDHEPPLSVLENILDWVWFDNEWRSHSVHIMHKIPYSYYIAKMKRISTLDQDFKPNDMPAEQV